MFLYILNTVAPVFLLVLVGFVSVKGGLLDGPMIDGLMKFAVQIAIPCLLFNATATIDLSSAYDWRLMLSFYTGALSCFALATFVAWRVFKRRPGEAVAVGFAALFSNLVLLGLPIVERGLDESALPLAFALVSTHAPVCYLVGITTMEIFRADGRSFLATARVVVQTMFRNSLMIGIGLGFLVNITMLGLPSFVQATLDMLTKASLPIALVALGGVLTRYTLSEEINEASTVASISLLLHPLIVLLACMLLGVADTGRNVMVLMASMSPGVNAYLFAAMYQRGQGTAASTVLLSTVLAIFSVSTWLWLLKSVL